MSENTENSTELAEATASYLEVEERFQAMLLRALHRVVADLERAMAEPDPDVVEVLRGTGRLILIERALLGRVAPPEIWRDWFGPAEPIEEVA